MTILLPTGASGSGKTRQREPAMGKGRRSIVDWFTSAV
jgi:hypothetical protein